MGHGFDDQGSKSDGTGMLRNWWTDEDRAAFDERGDKLVEQFDAFCPLDDGATCVNGRFTLGENIGDVGGLSLAYRAYKLSLNGEEAPVIDGLTGDQRFFLAWAQVWRSQQREDNYRRQIAHRSAQPGGIPGQRRRPADGRMVRGFRRERRRRALPVARGPRVDLVDPADAGSGIRGVRSCDLAPHFGSASAVTPAFSRL